LWQAYQQDDSQNIPLLASKAMSMKQVSVMVTVHIPTTHAIATMANGSKTNHMDMAWKSFGLVTCTKDIMWTINAMVGESIPGRMGISLSACGWTGECTSGYFFLGTRRYLPRNIS
jgi:hypothetical protein